MRKTGVNDCVDSLFRTRFRPRQEAVGSIYDFKIVSNFKICLKSWRLSQLELFRRDVEFAFEDGGKVGGRGKTYL